MAQFGGNALPSDFPEVVPVTYPEAHAYIRPRNEPGLFAPKYLAYDQIGKEVVDEEANSPSTTVGGTDGSGNGGPLPAENSRRTICGFALRTFWIVVVLAIVVVAAAVGGGVGGGIAASKSQHESGNSQTNISSGISAR
jgi:hypothetical protein